MRYFFLRSLSMRSLSTALILGALALSPLPIAADALNGSDNVALGAIALRDNISGSGNTAIGVTAMTYNTSGEQNTAIGLSALGSNMTGNHNVALGMGAGSTNTSGSRNTFIGTGSGLLDSAPVNNSTAIGSNAVVGSSNAVVLGSPEASVGIGNSTPQSRLQVGSSSTKYGDYLQLPVVLSTANPPASDCNRTTFAGRVALQDNRGQMTLWLCSAYSGRWVRNT